MDDDIHRSDKKLPLLTLDNGESIDSDFYPDKDDVDDTEVNEGYEDSLYMEINEDRFDCCSHHNNANWLSRILFFWPTAIIKKGRLSLEILGTIPHDESAEFQAKKLQERWNMTQDKQGNALFKTVLKRFRWKLCQLFFLNLFAASCDAVMPFFLREVMSYIQDDEEGHDNAFRALVFVSLMLGTIFFSRILKENLAFLQLKIGVQASQAITGMVYSKMTKISSATNKFYKKGDIISFIQVDAPKVTFLFETLPDVSRIPFLLVFLVITLYMFIGVSFLTAIGVILIFGLINYYLAKWTAIVQAKRMRKLDKRTNKISDIIDNIKLIKFNSWVEKFLKKVFKSRAKEIKVIIQKLMLWVINITFMNLNYPVLAITVFIIAIFGAKLSVAVPTALAILQILNSLHSSSRSLPLFIGDFVEFLVSMVRIQNFLLCPEIETDHIMYDAHAFDTNAIKVDNANLFWGFDEKLKKKKEVENLSDLEEDRTDIEIPKSTKKINSSDSSSDGEESDRSENTDDEEDEDDSKKVKISDKVTLKNLNISIEQGEFVAIIGEIGTGKSSILSALIGDMLPVDKLTYEKFKNYEIFDTRHEDNEENRDRLIALNHEVFDRFHYYRKRSVGAPKIHVKGSMSLMEQTPWVLNATIRDNILFGEPLDAAKYNKTIEICQLGRDLDILEGGDLTQIGEKGINLSGGQKARIGIARSVYAGKDIVLMDDPLSALDAHVKKQIFDEVLCDELRLKTRILITHAVDFLDRVDKIIVVEKGEILHQGTFDELKDLDYFKLILDHMKQEEICEEEEVKQDNVAVHNDFQNTNGYSNQVRKCYLSTRGSTITTDENKEVTKADWLVYFRYLTFTKWTVVSVTGLVIVIILKRVADLFFDYYLLYWIKDISETRHNHWDLFGPVLILSALVTITAFFTALIHIGFIFSISVDLFKNMLKRVCYAPVNMYFDITPTGVILNRFSKDIQTVEMVLPFTIRSQIINYVSIISGIAIAAYNVIWVLICIPFMVLGCYYFLRLYTKALKETSRIESISSSPILTHLSETISGISTIRTFGKVEDFERRQYFLQDQNVAAQLLRRGIKGWFNTRISIILTLFMSFAFIYSVLAKDSMDPVLIGLMMVYMMDIQFNLISLFRQMATVDSRMVCFERCVNMCNIPQEATMRLPVPKDQHGHEWVSHGQIEFRNYSAKYRPDAEVVLRDLNITFEPGQKIGVVGRTGAGKSTLCLAICRFIEPLKGQIFIDGVDISKVGIADLRDRITVIPQDPALFENSLRFNLDPDKQSTDEEILRLINKAGLTNLVLRDPNGLDAKITLRGDNLSSGEKQLICICRAILRKKKIVIMDEATANIDILTEKIIQKLIKDEFRESTVLTVAHRLNTIIKSHKILVMSYGSVVEFDEPSKLMNNQESAFYSLLTEFNN